MNQVYIEKPVIKILKSFYPSVLLHSTINNYVVTAIYDHFDNDYKKDGT